MTNRIRSTNDPWGGRAAAIEARAHRAVPAERGAALILAIGVLSVLIIISLTFWQSTRQEMQTATNTANSIRAELLTDGAFAIAIAFLNHDLAAHPSYTSLDHAWRTYFNGAWAVGKPWLWAPIENESGDLQQVPLFNNPAINRDPETLRGVPGIPEIPTIDGLVAGGFTMDRSDANYFGDNIYIPRILINPNTGLFEQDLIAGPFVVSSDLADSFLALAFGTLIDAVYPTYSDAIVELVLREPDNDIDPINEENDLLPDEQIHFWTDVDNDGDGLNDSMWLPIGGDVIFDADGIDNNLNNGPIINSDGIDNNLDGFVDDGFDGIDERGETAVFLYDGTADGLDNDRDGAVDEPDEQRLFLTTRIFDLVDGDVNDLIDLSRINTLAIWADRREELGLDPIDIPTDILDAVDALDNNFDLKVNGVETFVVRPAAGPFALDDDNPAFGYHQIASQYLTFPGMGISVFSSGETVTEIVGRVAILITDEASKVNINAAGGWGYHNFPVSPAEINTPLLPIAGPGETPNFTRAFASGVGPHEYELRVLPLIGSPRSRWIRQVLMGARQGFYQNGTPDASPPPFTFTLDYYDETFEGDATLPGYGFVDDNGNSLAFALDGIDNDGNGFIDDGIIAHDYDFNDSTFPTLAAKLEGMDEPGEYQRFRPLRNFVAENANFDNDGDDVIDEIGEMGDRFFRTHEQLKLVNLGTFNNEGFIGPRGIDEGVFSGLHNFITAHSQDRNDRHLHRDVLGDFSDDRGRRSTGPKLDYNLARAEEIANALRNDWRYPRSEPLIVNDDPTVLDRSINFPAAQAYALGLRREDTTVLTRDRLLGQMGLLDQVPGIDEESLVFEADASLRAGQLGVSIKDFADRDFARSELTSKVRDDWWAAAGNPERLDLSIPGNFESLTPEQQRAQGQLISYTVAGIESIRINEIMVRPVRRFEAEAITFLNDSANPLFAVNPNRFTPNLDFDPIVPALPPRPLPDFRMRVRTTSDRLADPRFSGFQPTTQEASEIFPVGEQPPTFPSWFRYIPGVTAPRFPFQTSGLPLMGLASAFTTYQSYISVVGPDRRVYEVPDVVQFSFQATDGLPPGRYYLKVNTEYIDAFFDADGSLLPVVRASAIYEGDLSFIFKLGTLDDDILNDIIRAERGDFDADGDGFGDLGIAVVDNAAWRTPAIVGSELLGGSTGTAFLQADNVYRGPIGPEFLQFEAPEFGAVTGFTIEVPGGVDGSILPQKLWLHVAVRSMRRDGRPLVLNYFDFSQEPDHEWVELVNVDTDTAVDVSGWELAVEGGDRLVMTIPNNTFIAPGGMLLLGMNKFDFFQVFGDPEGRGAFFENGIGLARGTFGTTSDDSFAGVTVPRTRTFLANGSVFIRNDSLDFVDRNGDGIADLQPTLDDAVPSTFDPITGLTDTDKAWDRIVELIVPTLLPRITGDPPLFGRFDAGAVGAIVLAGGIFPNRPEYDGIDNDGDNLILSTDLIDNDGDGFIDDFNRGPDDVAGTLDDIPLEGIDEGRFRRDLFDQINFPVPGAFNTRPSDFSSAFFTFFFGQVPPYVGPNTFVESPRWKEFVERRNFPGDNVIITLYEGPAFRNRVVDRVTYNQRDVENSAIDDVVRTTDLNFDDVADIAPIPQPLDENFTSFWPGNTMGVDFYRSLERKHPLYSGDRFGTQNRFTATDGNYDDWADSTGRWERVLTFSPTGTELPLEVSGLLDRFDAANGVYDQFAHAFHGSPLRMNATQRYAEDIFLVGRLDLVRPLMFKEADARNRNIVSAGDLLTLPHISKTNPLVTWRQFFDEDLGDRAFLFDVDSPNVSFALNEPPPVDTFRENLSYDQALLGQNFDIDDPQDFFQDIRAVIGNAAANSSLALSVGQAEVFQLAPAVTTWGTTGSGIPEAWVPVLLHDLVAPNTDTGLVFGTYQRRYLMQTPATLPFSVGIDRWPLESREAFYVSGNFEFFDTAPPIGPALAHVDGDGAESLFVWDGNDGLENGEYVLYLVMGDDLRTLLRAHNIAFNSFGTGLLTDGNFINESGNDDAFFGVDFVQKAIQTTPEERIVDVEVFTDRNGDRRVWTDIGGDGVQTGDLNRGFGGRPIETFGLEAGLEADASGVIRYGVIRVENNYLAVMLRNWSDAGNFNIFSRVVLAPRDKTPGRININTVQTRRTNNFGNPGDYFNPLVGLPGILERFVDSANINPSDRRLVLPPGLLNAVDPVFIYAGTNQAQALARQIVEQRQRSTFEAPDGRYYELTSDLLADAHGRFLAPPSDNFLRPPLVIADHNELNILGFPFPFSNDIDTNNNNRAAAFREGAFRFSRMQNLITTRSDVFEILVTVQAGYGTDTNGDGRINYRDDREFTATAEKSARTVYER